MFAGINMSWARLRLILARAIRLGNSYARNSYAREHILYCFSIKTNLSNNDLEGRAPG